MVALGAASAQYQKVFVETYYSGGTYGGGVFTWNPSSTATVNGGTIIAATGIATGRWIRDVSSGTVTPYDFGCKGDGSTNDTTAFNKCLALGTAVFVPPGTFTGTTRLLPVSGQLITGSGDLSIINCTGVNTNTIEFDNVTNVTIENVKVTYTGTNPGGNGDAGCALVMRSSAAFNLANNCHFIGLAGYGSATIYLCSDNTIQNCQVSGTSGNTAGWDILVYGGGSRNKLLNNRCQGAGGIGIGLLYFGTDTGVDNIVSGNVISTHTTYGVINYCSSATPVKNTLIAGNVISEISGLNGSPGSRGFGAGIYCAGAEYVNITGNNIYRTNISTDDFSLAPAAIGLNSCAIFSVTDNVIHDCFQYGIEAISGDLSAYFGLGGGVISGNTIKGTVNNAIEVRAQSFVNVTGNTIGNSSAAGIAIESVTATRNGIKVTDNIVVDCTTLGISLASIASPIVSNNRVMNNATGISFSSCSDMAIIDNVITGNSTNDLVIDSGCTGSPIIDSNIIKSSATNGVSDAFGAMYGQNVVSGQTTPYSSASLERTLAVGATPNVLNARMAIVNSGTNITDLLGPVSGQIITLRATGNTTLKNNGGSAATKLMLSGGVDFAMTAGATCTLEYIPNSGPWYEIGRKT